MGCYQGFRAKGSGQKKVLLGGRRGFYEGFRRLGL